MDFEAPEDPDKHFMLRHVEEHKDKDEFYRSLSARLDKSEARAAMLFIHGYNVSFEDAIFRTTAQLAVDLKFPGTAMAFSWPSYADPVKYTFDEQNAEVSIPALREVLEDLAARSGQKRVHIIAHSMGNRVLAALRSMDSTAQARNKAVFRELVLAAPDIDSRVFQSQVLPHIVPNVQHCTLYASSPDRALRGVAAPSTTTAPGRDPAGAAGRHRTGHDRRIAGRYQPAGTLLYWRRAVDRFGSARPGGRRQAAHGAVGAGIDAAQRAQILVDQARGSNRRRHGAGGRRIGITERMPRLSGLPCPCRRMQTPGIGQLVCGRKEFWASARRSILSAIFTRGQF